MYSLGAPQQQPNNARRNYLDATIVLDQAYPDHQRQERADSQLTLEQTDGGKRLEVATPDWHAQKRYSTKSAERWEWWVFRAMGSIPTYRPCAFELMERKVKETGVGGDLQVSGLGQTIIVFCEYHNCGRANCARERHDLWLLTVLCLLLKRAMKIPVWYNCCSRAIASQLPSSKCDTSRNGRNETWVLGPKGIYLRVWSRLLLGLLEDSFGFPGYLTMNAGNYWELRKFRLEDMLLCMRGRTAHDTA